jgi:nicotinamidase-related amidase
MTEPKTLLQLSGTDLTPSKIAAASLVLIDVQYEYLAGPLALPEARPAILRAQELLALARRSGAPVFHIAHAGRPGGLFDRSAERGRIVAELEPAAGEPVIEKSLPNAFAATSLHEALTKAGRKNIILAGFMTHMCVSSTARAALDLGYRVTIAADACATRTLPDGQGGTVDARTVHNVALVELSDRFAVIARRLSDLE